MARVIAQTTRAYFIAINFHRY
nr:hypothetical protein [Anthocerotibacter panamensis]